MRKVLAAAAAISLGLLAPALAQESGPTLQAWCVGGVAGIYNKAVVSADGTIRATNSILTPRPWPVVATEPDLAAQWLQQAMDAASVPPPPTDEEPRPLINDEIICGLDLDTGDGIVRVDLPDVHRALLQYVPAR